MPRPSNASTGTDASVCNRVKIIYTNAYSAMQMKLNMPDHAIQDIGYDILRYLY